MGVAQSAYEEAEPAATGSKEQSPRRLTNAAATRVSLEASTTLQPSASAKQAKHATTTTTKLSGLVLGLPQSGKKTLLLRLQGKDPFLSSQTAATALTVIPDKNNSTSTPLRILVPYKAAPDQSTWDRIHLSVTAAVNMTNRNLQQQQQQQQQQQERADFYVVLICPSHNRTTIQQYLTDTIQRLLLLHGKSCAPQDDTNETGKSQCYPLCICLLLNYRDRKPAATGDWLEESDMYEMTRTILQDCPDTVEPDQLVLHCGQTSLKNCYGLQLLHHFMYQAYLQRKRMELEQMLQSVLLSRTRANRTVPVATSYETFLELLQETNLAAPTESNRNKTQTGKKGKRPSPREKQNDTSSVPERPSNQGRRRIVPIDKLALPAEDALKQQKQKRRIVTNNNKRETPTTTDDTVTTAIKSTATNANDDLEAFLGSGYSDDDDEVIVDEKASTVALKSRDSEPLDSDDETDDFFYTDAGQRLCTAKSEADKTTNRGSMETTKLESLANNKRADHDLEETAGNVNETIHTKTTNSLAETKSLPTGRPIQDLTTTFLTTNGKALSVLRESPSSGVDCATTCPLHVAGEQPSETASLKQSTPDVIISDDSDCGNKSNNNNLRDANEYLHNVVSGPATVMQRVTDENDSESDDDGFIIETIVSIAPTEIQSLKEAKRQDRPESTSKGLSAAALSAIAAAKEHAQTMLTTEVHAPSADDEVRRRKTKDKKKKEKRAKNKSSISGES